MSESNPWASPSGDPTGSGARPPAGPPAFGPPPMGPPPSGPPRFGPPPSGPPPGGPPAFGAPNPGWSPPPKPGLIPLRPLLLGDILGAAFRVFRRNPRTTFGTSLLFQIVTLFITLLVAGGAVFFAFNRITSALPQDRDAILPGTILGASSALIVPYLLTIAVSAILQGILVIETSHQVLGEKMRLRGLLRQARGRIWALIGWVFLLAAAGVVALGIIIGLVALLAFVGGTGGTVAAVLVGLFGFLGLVVLAVWIGVKTLFVPSILMLERMTIRRAIARSWRLTKNGFWRTFGIVLLVYIIIAFASGVVSTPVSFLSQIGGGIVRPNGEINGDGITTYIIVMIAGQFVTTIIGAIGTVIQTATLALLYIDLRIRREALDLELVRYVELRSAGASPLPDPYRTPSRPDSTQWGPPA